ncbi:hypothetical protein R3P38DRAFT_188201 [Favolaschia claudopus]|uniref:Uncharacterized protein n=1 Tax=Favolaschia claudopus TaxID=2862362 RepID=A0AAW0CYZ7_9AGAR
MHISFNISLIVCAIAAMRVAGAPSDVENKNIETGGKMRPGVVRLDPFIIGKPEPANARTVKRGGPGSDQPFIIGEPEPANARKAKRGGASPFIIGEPEPAHSD